MENSGAYQFCACDKHLESRTNSCLYCEIERLRTALNQIADFRSGDFPENWSAEMASIAETALSKVL